jgi:hypothetical protein
VAKNSSADQVRQNCFLDVQTVLGLIENYLRVRFESLLVDLLSPMGGQTMHDERIWFGQFYERLVAPQT